MEYKLSIKGIDCNNCANKLEEKINNLKEIDEFKFNFYLETGLIKTNYDISKMLKKILKITKKIEYKAKVELINE